MNATQTARFQPRLRQFTEPMSGECDQGLGTGQTSCYPHYWPRGSESPAVDANTSGCCRISDRAT